MTNLGDAATAVYEDNLPAAGPELEALKARVASGMGAVLILGRHTDPRRSRRSPTALSGKPASSTLHGSAHGQELEHIAAVVNWVGPKVDALARNISWLSAVRVHERSLLDVNGAEVLVKTNPRDLVQPGTPILLRIHAGKGTIYVLNEWLRNGDQSARIASMLTMLEGIEGAENYDFQRWPDFNWLLYGLSRTAAGVPVVSYGDWIASPVPNRAEVRILAAILAMFAMFLGAYLIVRRYSLRHPELLEHFYRSTPSAKPQPAALGAAAAAPAAPAASGSATAHGDPRWEIVGFHRPLSGFFYNYLLSLIMMIPLNFVFTFYIERNYVNPFLEARGAWGGGHTVHADFSSRCWTSAPSQAMVKYFAEYRVRDPGRAITYAQFYIWFHALGGVLAVTIARDHGGHLHARNDGRLPDLVRHPAHLESVPRLYRDLHQSVPRAAALRLCAGAGGADLRADAAHPDGDRDLHAALGADASGVRRRDGRGFRLRARRSDQQHR